MQHTISVNSFFVSPPTIAIALLASLTSTTIHLVYHLVFPFTVLSRHTAALFLVRLIYGSPIWLRLKHTSLFGVCTMNLPLVFFASYVIQYCFSNCVKDRMYAIAKVFNMLPNFPRWSVYVVLALQCAVSPLSTHWILFRYSFLTTWLIVEHVSK